MRHVTIARYSVLLAVALFAALASGCQSGQTVGLPRAQSASAYQRNISQSQNDPGRIARTSLVFHTDRLARLYTRQGQTPGFLPGDWEYARNDTYLSVGARSVSQVYLDRFIQVSSDRIDDYSGRIHTSSSTYTRSIRAGATSR